MIIAKNLKKYFSTSKGLLRAVDDVSFEIPEGQTLGLVGESGCGKSTLGRLLLRLLEPTSGQVHFDGTNIFSLSPDELKKWRQEAQMIFQDPYASLNPRMTAQDIISEPLKIHHIDAESDIIAKSFQQVSLNPHHRCRYPHEFSGGQRQRIGIARALAPRPKLLIADEPVSSLDVSVQAQVLNLFGELKRKLNLTMLFISHDLNVVEYLADTVAVMYAGKIMEIAPVEQIFKLPLHPYTQGLIASNPTPESYMEQPMRTLRGEVLLPLNPPPGCRLEPRCPLRVERCKSVEPLLEEKRPRHWAACHEV